MRAAPVLLLWSLIAAASGAPAEGLWQSLRDGASRAAEAAGSAVSKGAEATGEVAGRVADAAKDGATETADHFHREGTPAELRERVDRLAADALDRLILEQPDAGLMFDRSYGFAVFEARQVSLGVVAGYGYGVAVERGGEFAETAPESRTYMKMAVAGVGVRLGFGGFAHQLVLLFEDEAAFRRFIIDGLDASAEAVSLVGDSHHEVISRFVSGVAAYRLTEGGFKVAASLAGTRFWPDEALNARLSEQSGGPAQAEATLSPGPPAPAVAAPVFTTGEGGAPGER